MKRTPGKWISVKLIKEGKKIAEQHRELVDRLKKNIAQLERKTKSKPD